MQMGGHFKQEAIDKKDENRHKNLGVLQAQKYTVLYYAGTDVSWI